MKFSHFFRHPTLDEEIASTTARLKRLHLQQTLQLVEIDTARAGTQAKIQILQTWGQPPQPQPEPPKPDA